ncbi:MAG: hypothetical protein PW999_09770 [Paraburkholderia tropica]|nr:hypothetical protein [Paraburkholderia tropica]
MTLKPLSGDRVEIKATGTRDQIREAVGAPNSALDWQSDAVAAMRYALEHDDLSTGTELLFRAVLNNMPQQ